MAGDKGRVVLSLVDYFVVAGLREDALENTKEEPHVRPLQRSYRPYALAHLPDVCSWNNPVDPDSIVMLAFPSGLRFAHENSDRRIRYHTFVMTKEDGARVYGACLTFYEHVKHEKLLGAMRDLELMHTLMHAPSDNDGARFSSSFDPTSDALYAPKAICLISQISAVACFEQFLRQLYLLSQTDPSTRLPIESYLATIIYDTPFPPPGCAVAFKCMTDIVCARPRPNTLPLFEYSLRRLLSLFRPQDVCTMVACVMLEQQMIIRSPDYELMVLVAESVTHLMYPFPWQHVYVPILPTSLIHILGAPVPFIMGLHEDIDDPAIDEIQCVVDIKTCRVRLREPVPQLPYADTLVAAMKELIADSGRSSGCDNIMRMGGVRGLEDLRTGRAMPPLPHNPGTREDLSFTTEVRLLFLSTWADMLSGYESYMIVPDDPEAWLAGVDTDEEIFDSVAFLSDQPKAFASFLQPFMQTQVFMSFLNTQLSNHLNTPKVTTCFDMLVRSRCQLQNLWRTLEHHGHDTSTTADHAQSSEDDLGRQAISMMKRSIDQVEVDYVVPPPKRLTAPTSAASVHKFKDTHRSMSLAAVDARSASQAAMRLRNKYKKRDPKPKRSVDSASPDLVGISSSPLMSRPKRRTSADAETATGSETKDGGSSSITRTRNKQVGSAGGEIKGAPSKVGKKRLPARPTSTDVASPPSRSPPSPRTLPARPRRVPHDAKAAADSTCEGETSPASSTARLRNAATATSPDGQGAKAASPITPEHVQPAQADRPVSVRRQSASDAAATMESIVCGRREFPLPDKSLMKHLVYTSWPRKLDRRDMFEEATDTSSSRSSIDTGSESADPSADGDSTEDGESGFAAQIHVAQQLLDDCEEKIKNLVLVHMDPTTVSAMGIAPRGVTAAGRENTLITTLCRAIERAAGHGYRLGQGQAALWVFVTLCSRKELPEEVQRCINEVQAMSFLRTDLGRARAWVRLTLEKRCLSDHLRLLTSSCPDVLSELYRDFAFIRQPELLSQLLSQLLLLTTINVPAFSANYPPCPITYHVVITTARGFRSGTNGNVIFKLRGDLNHTDADLGRGRFGAGSICEFDVVAKNLGSLQELELCLGGSSSWTIDRIQVNNMLTDQSLDLHGPWKISTGDSQEPRLRINVRQADDGSLSGIVAASDGDAEGDADAHNTSQTVAVFEQEFKPKYDELCEELAGAVNNIVKFCFQRSEHEFQADTEAELLLGGNRLVSRSSTSLDLDSISSASSEAIQPPAASPQRIVEERDGAVVAVHRRSSHKRQPSAGDRIFQRRNSVTTDDDDGEPLALCPALANVMYFGFKQRTLIGPARHPMDFVERVKRQMSDKLTACDEAEKRLVEAVDAALSLDMDKDARLERVFCAGVSRKMLAQWMQTIVNAAAVSSLYQPWALMRMGHRMSELIDTLKCIVDLELAFSEDNMIYVPTVRGQEGRWAIRKSRHLQEGSEASSPSRTSSVVSMTASDSRA